MYFKGFKGLHNFHYAANIENVKIVGCFIENIIKCMELLDRNFNVDPIVEVVQFNSLVLWLFGGM